MWHESKTGHSKGLAMNGVGAVCSRPYEEMAERVEAKLNQLAGLARERPKHKYTTLAYLLNEGFLAQCFQSLGKDKAPGDDGETWKEYERDLESNLGDLVKRMKAKNYWPQPVRRAYIPKDEHSQRPLGIPATEDKIVQKGVSRILEAIYESDFLDCSYGFRPGRSCHDALGEMNRIIERSPINHIVEADIKGFFDNVSHEWMMSFLKERINDPNFLRIIERFLKAGYKDSGLLVATEKGTPQEGNLSPLLANLFLHYVFDMWMVRHSPQTPWARYADDGLVHCRSREEAERLLKHLKERFKECGLELHPDKTGFAYCKDADRREEHSETSFDFLSYTFRPRRAKNWRGKFFVSFLPAISNEAAKALRREIHDWRMHLKPDKSIEDLSRMYNPVHPGLDQLLWTLLPVTVVCGSTLLSFCSK